MLMPHTNNLQVTAWGQLLLWQALPWLGSGLDDITRCAVSKVQDLDLLNLGQAHKLTWQVCERAWLTSAAKIYALAGLLSASGHA